MSNEASRSLAVLVSFMKTIGSRDGGMDALQCTDGTHPGMLS